MAVSTLIHGATAENGVMAAPAGMERQGRVACGDGKGRGREVPAGDGSGGGTATRR